MSAPKLHVTDKTILIDDHYRRLGIDQPWTNDEVDRLCKLLRVTRHELGKLALVDFETTNRFVERNKWPPHVCLVLRLIQDTVLGTHAVSVPVDVVVV